MSGLPRGARYRYEEEGQTERDGGQMSEEVVCPETSKLSQGWEANWTSIPL